MCFDCELRTHGKSCGEPFDYTLAYQARLPMIECSTSCVKWVRKDKRGKLRLNYCDSMQAIHHHREVYP